MRTQMSEMKQELQGVIKGSVLVADDLGYEEARQIWNAMIDRRPASIVQCADADDVVCASPLPSNACTATTKRWRWFSNGGLNASSQCGVLRK